MLKSSATSSRPIDQYQNHNHNVDTFTVETADLILKIAHKATVMGPHKYKVFQFTYIAV